MGNYNKNEKGIADVPAKEVPAEEAMTAARDCVRGVTANIAKLKGVSSAAIICSLIFCLAVSALAYWYGNKQKGNIYVIDEASRVEASRADGSAQKDLEIISHVERFHEKFYNLSPNITTIEENITEASDLADAQVQLMDNARRERQFYTNLIRLNMVEEIHRDSIVVNIRSYPYKVRYYGHLYLIRPSKLSRYAYESSCELINVPRSRTNPHGLIIQNFKEDRMELESQKNN